MAPIAKSGGTVRPFVHACAACLSACALTAGFGREGALRAQSPVEGYTSAHRTLPVNSSHGVPLGAGVVFYDGFALVHDDGSGSPPSIILQTGPLFPSFVLPLDATTVLFGESSQGNIWRVPLQGPAPGAPLAQIPFNYAAARLDAGSVVVSAKPGGFGVPDCELIEIDLQTGASASLGSVPGASGPVLVPPAPAGGLLYATGTLLFPAPSGTAEILHWSNATLAAARAGTVTLDATNATVLVTGLDAVSSMALDGDGDLLFTDWFQDRLAEVDDLFGPRPAAKTVSAYGASTLSATQVLFVPAATAAGPDFEPFQEAGGDALYVTESNFLSTHRLSRIEPRRARLATPTAPIPPGPFSIPLTDGPSLGTAFVVVSLLAPAPFENRVVVAGFEQRIGWNPASTAPLLSEFVALDALGQGALQAINPGVGGLGLSLQAAFADRAVAVVGSTSAVSITLR